MHDQTMEHALEQSNRPRPTGRPYAPGGTRGISEAHHPAKYAYMSRVTALLADAIRTRREELGLSQSDLAEMIGVTYQQVHKYERKANSISFARAMLIFRQLQLPLERLDRIMHDAAEEAGLGTPASPLESVAGADTSAIPTKTRRYLLIKFMKMMERIGPERCRAMIQFMDEQAAEPAEPEGPAKPAP